ncbi:MAG: tRNA (cytidine(34)-2'-O)-methyltransferase [Rubripirellula sp.]
MNKKQSQGDEERAIETLQSQGGDSFSREDGQPQPTHDNLERAASEHDDDRFPAHVVLYQPEIPQNTGNIGRTCVAVGAKLWIVRPAGFQISDSKLRRAGLDYWQHLQLGDAVNWEDLQRQLPGRRQFFFSRFATRTIWDADFAPGDVFVFGRETSGLPDTILDPKDPCALRLPMSSHVRSLNLATTVGIVMYEHQRQLRAAGHHVGSVEDAPRLQ